MQINPVIQSWIFSKYIFGNIINVFTISFVQFNASLQNKNITNLNILNSTLWAISIVVSIYLLGYIYSIDICSKTTSPWEPKQTHLNITDASHMNTLTEHEGVQKLPSLCKHFSTFKKVIAFVYLHQLMVRQCINPSGIHHYPDAYGSLAAHCQLSVFLKLSQFLAAALYRNHIIPGNFRAVCEGRIQVR